MTNQSRYYRSRCGRRALRDVYDPDIPDLLAGRSRHLPGSVRSRRRRRDYSRSLRLDLCRLPRALDASTKDQITERCAELWPDTPVQAKSTRWTGPGPATRFSEEGRRRLKVSSFAPPPSGNLIAWSRWSSAPTAPRATRCRTPSAPRSAAPSTTARTAASPSSSSRRSISVNSAPFGGDPNIQVAAAIIRQDGRDPDCAAARMAEMGGLWEFPGGKIEPGETPRPPWCARLPRS